MLHSRQINPYRTEFLLNLASKYDFIRGVVGWVDLSSEDIESNISKLIVHSKFRGVRHTHYDEKGEFMQDENKFYTLKDSLF